MRGVAPCENGLRFAPSVLHENTKVRQKDPAHPLSVGSFIAE